MPSVNVQFLKSATDESRKATHGPIRYEGPSGDGKVPGRTYNFDAGSGLAFARECIEAGSAICIDGDDDALVAELKALEPKASAVAKG